MKFATWRARRISAGLIASAVLIMTAAACSSNGGSGGSSGPVVIGVSAAQTGYLSTTDLGFIDGIKLGVKSVNTAGGAGGHRLSIASVLDEQSTPSVGVSNVNTLIYEDNVDAIFSGADSTACAAAQAVVTRAQVPMVCVAQPPAGSSYQFEVSSSVKLMTDTVMSYLRSRGIKTVAFLESTNEYGQLVGGLIKAAAAEDGVTVTATTTVSSSSTDLTATMQKLASSKPGAIVDSLAGSEHIIEAKGAQAAGLRIPLVLFSDTLQTFQQAAAAYADTYFVVQAPQAYPQVTDAALKSADEQFVAAFDASGDSPSLIASAAYGWDAAHVLAAAVKKSGHLTGPAVQRALQSMRYQGAVTLYQYSASDHAGAGSGLDPYSVGSYKNGKLTIAGEG